MIAVFDKLTGWNESHVSFELAAPAPQPVTSPPVVFVVSPVSPTVVPIVNICSNISLFPSLSSIDITPCVPPYYRTFVSEHRSLLTYRPVIDCVHGRYIEITQRWDGPGSGYFRDLALVMEMAVYYNLTLIHHPWGALHVEMGDGDVERDHYFGLSDWEISPSSLASCPPSSPVLSNVFVLDNDWLFLQSSVISKSVAFAPYVIGYKEGFVLRPKVYWEDVWADVRVVSIVHTLRRYFVSRQETVRDARDDDDDVDDDNDNDTIGDSDLRQKKARGQRIAHPLSTAKKRRVQSKRLFCARLSAFESWHNTQVLMTSTMNDCVPPFMPTPSPPPSSSPPPPSSTSSSASSSSSSSSSSELSDSHFTVVTIRTLLVASSDLTKNWFDPAKQRLELSSTGESESTQLQLYDRAQSYSSSCIYIGVHIRRGDAINMNFRIQSTGTYVNMFTELLSLLPLSLRSQLCFVLYTESTVDIMRPILTALSSFSVRHSYLFLSSLSSSFARMIGLPYLVFIGAASSLTDAVASFNSDACITGPVRVKRERLYFHKNSIQDGLSGYDKHKMVQFIQDCIKLSQDNTTIFRTEALAPLLR